MTKRSFRRREALSQRRYRGHNTGGSRIHLPSALACAQATCKDIAMQPAMSARLGPQRNSKHLVAKPRDHAPRSMARDDFASPPDTDLDETAHAFDDPEGVLDAAALDRGLHRILVALVVVYGALVPIVVVREVPPPGRSREFRRFNSGRSVESPPHRVFSSWRPSARQVASGKLAVVAHRIHP